jgi:hypothetical protein
MVVLKTVLSATALALDWQTAREVRIEDETHRTVTIAARLIRAQVPEALFVMSTYPSCSDRQKASNRLSHLLSLFYVNITFVRVKANIAWPCPCSGNETQVCNFPCFIRSIGADHVILKKYR